MLPLATRSHKGMHALTPPPLDLANSQTRSFAFAVFLTKDDAAKAVEKLNNRLLLERTIKARPETSGAHAAWLASSLEFGSGCRWLSTPSDARKRGSQAISACPLASLTLSHPTHPPPGVHQRDQQPAVHRQHPAQHDGRAGQGAPGQGGRR